jgi:hypothetical protein
MFGKLAVAVQVKEGNFNAAGQRKYGKLFVKSVKVDGISFVSHHISPYIALVNCIALVNYIVSLFCKKVNDILCEELTFFLRNGTI